MRKKMRFPVIFLAACAASSAVSAGTVDERPMLERLLADHLEKRGDVCIGRPEWPVFVTERDVVDGSRDALQMPVLDRLGLVESRQEAISGKGDKAGETLSFTRYMLTDEGKRYYRKRTSTGAADTKNVAEHDVCVGRLSLDRLVNWDKRGEGSTTEILATYTYRMATPQWIGDPEVRQVFPMLRRMVDGQGSMLLQQRFRREGESWIASSPWE